MDDVEKRVGSYTGACWFACCPVLGMHGAQMLEIVGKRAGAGQPVRGTIAVARNSLWKGCSDELAVGDVEKRVGCLCKCCCWPCCSCGILDGLHMGSYSQPLEDEATKGSALWGLQHVGVKRLDTSP